jgi:two-component system nitrogen regulation response regulator NtrX
VKNLALSALDEEIAAEDVERHPAERVWQKVLPRRCRRSFRSTAARSAGSLRADVFRIPSGGERGNMTRLAEKTGLERTHLYRKLKQLGLNIGRRGDERE